MSRCVNVTSAGLTALAIGHQHLRKINAGNCSPVSQELLFISLYFIFLVDGLLHRNLSQNRCLSVDQLNWFSVLGL